MGSEIETVVPVPDSRIDLEVTAVGFGHHPGDGQAEPEPVTGRPGREERLDGLARHLLRHALRRDR